MALGQLRAPRVDMQLLLGQRRIERRQRDRGGRRNREVAWKRSHRIARENRVLSDVRDGSFPNDAESFDGTSEEERKRLYGIPESERAIVVEMPKAK